LAFPTPNGENKPKKYYCPAGTTARLTASNGYYTIPQTEADANIRTGQVACSSSEVCIDGEAFPKITWSPTSCSALAVDENNVVSSTGRTLVGQLNSNLTGYSVNYTLVSFKLAPDLITTLANGPCDPAANAAPYSNAGIFAVNLNSGAITMTRTTFPYYLNYEPTNALGVKCPVAGVRYALRVSANAFGQGTVTTITCDIAVSVNDRNDQPQWPNEMSLPVYYRAIPEKSVINTPVTRCDSGTNSFYGCPVVHPLGFAVELTATDEDYFSVLRYSFVNGVGSALNYASDNDNPFRINSCSGLISMRTDRTISYLTDKTFNFTVRVEDDGNGGEFPKRSADVIVIIYITDAPDPPVLDDPSLYDFTVLENRAADQLIGRVNATDPDLGSVISYRLKVPIDGDAFYMDSSFNIRTSQIGSDTIDFESTKTVYTLNVEAFDCTPVCPGLSDIKAYTVRVLNTNDPPRFQDVSPFYILENSADLSPVCFDSSGVCSGSTLDRVKTIDVDGAPITPGDNTVYTIVTANSPFQIDSATGQIRTKVGTKALLNFEDETLSDISGTGRSFKVIVRATSTGNGDPAFVDQTYTIYLVDQNEAPVITNVPIFFALETAPAGSACDPININLPALTATDPDNADQFLRGAVAPKQSVTFSRVTNVFHPTLNDSGTLFTVSNIASGGAFIQVVGTLDYETAPVGGLACGAGSTVSTRCYIILVRATDNGPPPAGIAETNVTIRIIDVNDGPSFPAPLSRSIQVSEGISSASQSVSAGTYTATDQDDATLTYSIISGTGAAFFDLVAGCSGACFAVYKKAGVLFDFESSQTTFNLDVSVTDLKGSKYVGQGCGLINGIPSGCDQAANGSICQATNGPFRSEYRCYEFCRPTSNVSVIPRRDTYFCDYNAINANFSKVPVGPAFQQTADQNLRFTIDVTDYNDPPYIIGDNGVADGFSCLVNTTVAASKQNRDQIAVASLRATDVDVTYAAAPFTFAKADPSDPFWNTFDIDNSTGRIGIYPTVVNNVNVNKNLTLGQYYTAKVTVLDQYPHPKVAPRMSSNCTVVVVVGPANERPSLTNPAPASVLEGTALGYVVYTAIAPNLTAVDPDVLNNPRDVLTFSMSESPFFLLDSATSMLTLHGSPLDYESLQGSSFQQLLVIRVVDLQGASDVGLVTINIIDRNEKPTWAQPTLLTTLPENSPAGALVIDLKPRAVDPDTFANGVTTFKNTSFTILSGCSTGCPFQLASPNTNGSLVIKTGQTLDFEGATKSWTFVVRATDGGDTSLFDDLTLTVSLTDVNEAPTIATNQQFTVPEGSSGTFLTDLSTLIVDPDAADPFSALQVNITGGDPTGIFTIINGRLFVSSTKVLDFEDIRQFNLNITVRDTGGLSATGGFRITVTNVNDVSITAVSYVTATALNCGAVTRVKITGTNFGMVSKSPAASLVVQYRRPVSTADPSPPVRTATNCSVTSPTNTEIQCDIPAAAGMDYVFGVTITVTGLISGDSFQGFASSLRSSVPTITSISGVSALPTSGSATSVVITGTCFGTTSDLITFGNNLLIAFSWIEFCDYTTCSPLGTGCVVTNQTTITCTNAIPPGLGANLKWRVKILGQLIASQYTQGAYAPPALTANSVPLVPTAGNPPSPYFVITGTNFGPVDSAPNSAYFTYLTTNYALRSCKVTTAYIEMTCQSSDPGVGVNMRMFVSFGGQLSSASPYTLNFALPTVTSIDGDGATGASTLGGQFINLNGANFGPICGLPGASVDAGGVNCQFVSATYKKGSTSILTGLPIVYTATPCAVVSQTQIVCATAPGTGAGHTWSLTVGGQAATVSPTAATTSYAAPVVATYDGVGATNARTNGGQLINIQGSNFGPVGGASVVGLYGNKDINPREFTSTSCTVTVAHTTISCILAPGAGAELSWIVIVDGLEGRNELTNYGVPVLDSTTFDNSTFLNNDGSNVISITGLNFGPASAPGPYLQSASFGPSSFPKAYTALCTVVSHTSITCTLGAGAGSNLRMVVTVKGQQSALSAFSLSYRPPDVSGGLLPVSAEKRTEGGTTFFIRGRGFSLCDPKSSLKVLWNEDVAVVGAINRALDVTGTFDSTGLVANPACPVGQYAQVSFILPEMNVARRVRVYMQVTTSAFGGSIQSTDFIDFSYDNPVLTSIFAEASAINFGGVRVTVFGNNFCKSESCCRTFLDNVALPAENVVSHSHTRIVLELTKPGSIFVRCGGTISSNALSFSTNSPFVFGTVPQLNQYEFNPVGNETVEVWGLYFGDTLPNVTLSDNITMDIVSHQTVDCYDPSRPATADSFAFDSGAQCYRTIVTTPALTGRKLPLNVVRGATKSLADDTRFEFLSYKLPVIATATGTAFAAPMATEGGGQIILTGSFFGVQQGQIIIGDPTNYPVPCTVTLWTDTEVRCNVGAGDGFDLPVRVVQASGDFIVASSNINIDFLPPSDLDFDNSLAFNTQGGGAFDITGSNLGRPNRATAMVGGFNCILIQSNSTTVRCQFPEGEGTNLAVTVSVGGQTASAVKKARYAVPRIDSVTPSSNLPTAGGTLMQITGENFGVNQLKLLFDSIVITERFRDPDPTLYKDPFIYPGTNHTQILLYLPPFYGARRLVRVSVRGQVSTTAQNISYAPPTIGNITVINQDGTRSAPFSTSDDLIFPDSAFNTSGSGLVSLGRRRRRLTIEQSYGAWQSRGVGPCEASVLAKNMFWRQSTEIAPNGQYRRTFNHYADGQCDLSFNQTFVVRVEGTYTDEGAMPLNQPTSACGLSRVYTDRPNSVTVTVLSNSVLQTFFSQCSCVEDWRVGVDASVSSKCLLDKTNCPLLSTLYGTDFPPGATRWGVYVVSNDKDIYMSKTVADLFTLQTRSALKFPDIPSASVLPEVESLVSNIPKGPTDGCFSWEPIRTYLDRAQGIAKRLGIPINDVPRDCYQRALLELSGSNFGAPLTADQLATASPDELPSLRVFFVPDNTSIDPFEASTVVSPGNHKMICPPPDCFQTHDKIRFWIPLGLGKTLRIRVHVGDQSQYASTRFSYSPPRIEELNPGTVRLSRSFQNARGDGVVIRGYNFGGRATLSSVLISGRPCINSVWTSGSTTDADGRPYVSCEAALDVVGPKSVMLCIAGQLTFERLFRTDGPVLLAGEASGAWNTSKPFTTDYAVQLRSLSLSRCPTGTTGRLYELCVDCPKGAQCEDGSFSGPKSDKFFFDYEVPTRNADGTIDERAKQLCQPESYNVTLLDEYPDLVQRETCNAFVGCEPKSACIGNSQCNFGYEYAMPTCLAKRGYKNESTFLQITREQVAGTPNACNVTLNPYTFEYEGVDDDCRGDLPAGATCNADNPEYCAKCTVFKDGTDSYYGACECVLPARCSLCTIRTHFRLNNECVPCPENPGLLIGGLFAAAIAVAIVGWYLQREQVNLAFITIGIDYFQVLAIFSSTKVPWPAALQSLFNIMSVFNFNIDIAAPECISPNLDYEVKWWLQMALPLALLGILATVYFGYAGVKMARWGIHQPHVYQSHLSALIAIFMVAMYYLYLVLTKKALEVFNCNPVDPDDGFLYTAFTSLSCDGGGLCRCGAPGGPQVRLVPFAITFLVLYTFGYPAYIAITLRRNALLVREDQYLRAYEVGYVRKTNPDCYDMRKRYSKLYYQFKPRYSTFWILVLLMRKFWIAFAFILFRGNPSFQLAVVLLVLFTSIVFQVLWRPFLSTGDRPGIVRELDAMAERSIKEPVFAQYREIQRRVQECMTLDVEHRRRMKQTKQGAQLFSNFSEDSGKNLGMSLVNKPKEKVSRSVAAARWFTNLNTLEFILLGCGILVCLAGIMFEASARDNRALVRGQVDAITWIVVIVVIFSLVYYVIFFAAEVAPAALSTILSLCRKKNKTEDDNEYYDPNINLEENPMFAAPKVEFADNRVLQAELDQQLTQLKLAEQQNRRLREELKNKKMEAQLDETANAKVTGLEDVQPQKQRKDFAQTRLTQALVGPNRQRARGGRKVQEEEEEEEDAEGFNRNSNRRSVFSRMSVFNRKPKGEDEH